MRADQPIPVLRQDPVSRTEILQWNANSPLQRCSDQIATEEPLEIQLEERPLSVTMRTPGYDRELAAGFLFSEGIIRARKDLLQPTPFWQHAGGNLIGVFLEHDVPVDFTRLTRHVFASSSCGICGKATIASVLQNFSPVGSQFQIAAERLLNFSLQMREAQTVFRSTGGLHAAALFCATGDLLVLREDVGRHNAVDKVLGHALLNDWVPLDRHILVVSGRASFEILQKALSAGIPIVAAVSAPSSLAIDFASKSGQTLIGFLREQRMNIYTGHERVRVPS